MTPAVRPGSLGAWLLASRPPTLTAAVAPVLVGTGIAVHDGVFRLLPAAAALFAAVMLQVGANFANDLSDFQRGADTDRRIGPPRATQRGLLTPRQVRTGMIVVFALAVLAGVYLAVVGGWPIVAIGLASIGAAITYTGGPWPYGYRALGELFVFVFFGLVAVTGTYYVQAGELPGRVVGAAVPVGLTVTAILVVNNVRDIETDREAGKRTLAVYLGRGIARWTLVALLAGAYLASAGLWLIGDFSGWTLLSWLSIPLAVGPALAVLTAVEGPPLNHALKATARLHFIFGLLLAIGLAV